jgi:Asp/Glu/hydantoin racemase
MNMIVKGGYSYQGYSVGILMFDKKRFPMPPGDVGNATTYPFPVLMRQIPNLEDNPYPPLKDERGDFSPEVQMCIEAAQQLEQDGVRAIAMCCGFFSLIQPVIAAAVNVPVITSPLIMIPIIRQLIKPDQSIVVVTAAAELLSEEFFSAVGVDRSNRLSLVGLDNSAAFNAICMGATGIVLETDDLRDDVLNGIEQARLADQKIGAVLLECTSLPPYASDVNKATGLPVFDFISCVEWLHRSVVPKQYQGYI